MRATLYTNDRKETKYYDGETFTAYRKQSRENYIKFTVSEFNIMKTYGDMV